MVAYCSDRYTENRDKQFCIESNQGTTAVVVIVMFAGYLLPDVCIRSMAEIHVWSRLLQHTLRSKYEFWSVLQTTVQRRL